MALEMKLSKRGTECELRLIGRFDAATADSAHDVLSQLLDKYENMILNCADLAYISSAGLRVLKSLRMEAMQKNVTLALKGVNKPVTEVLEMTGFAVLFKYI